MSSLELNYQKIHVRPLNLGLPFPWNQHGDSFLERNLPIWERFITRKPD